MSALPGIDHLLARLTHTSASPDDDWRSTVVTAFVVALGGAAFGLLVVGVHALVARLWRFRGRSVLPSPSPDETAHGITVVEVERPWPWTPKRRRGSRSTVEVAGTREASRGAGEEWLTGYMARLRLVMPGLPTAVAEESDDPGELTGRVLPHARNERKAPGADATVKIGAIALNRLVWDELEGDSDPITLLVPDAETLCVDATIQTRALPLLLDSPPPNETLPPVVHPRLPPHEPEPAPSPNVTARLPSSSGIVTLPSAESADTLIVGTFDYGARRA